MSELVPRREETRARHSSRIGCGLSPYLLIASSVGCLSVSIPYHRLVCGSAEQQNEEQRRLRLERGSEGRAPRRRRRRERWQEEWRRSSGWHVRW